MRSPCALRWYDGHLHIMTMTISDINWSVNPHDQEAGTWKRLTSLVEKWLKWLIDLTHFLWSTNHYQLLVMWLLLPNVLDCTSGRLCKNFLPLKTKKTQMIPEHVHSAVPNESISEYSDNNNSWHARSLWIKRSESQCLQLADVMGPLFTFYSINFKCIFQTLRPVCVISC